MQRRAKLMLSMRSVEDFPKLIEQLDNRKDWNREKREIVNLLDLFPSLKYSYSSQLPSAYKKVLLIFIVLLILAILILVILHGLTQSA